MTTLLALFIIAVLGFIFSSRQLVLMLLAIEIMILVASYRFVYYGFLFDDLMGAHFSLYLLVLAGAESAVALSLLVAYHRIRGSIQL